MGSCFTTTEKTQIKEPFLENDTHAAIPHTALTTTSAVKAASNDVPSIGKAVHLNSTNLVYPIFSSVSDFDTIQNDRSELALIMLHGRKRNASDYYNLGLEVMKKSGAQNESTIIIAPQMLDDTDISYICSLPDSVKIGPNEQALRAAPDTFLRWQANWEAGEPSINITGTGGASSSYDILDDIISRLSDKVRFPRLQRIVFIGHGGGAQVLIRYVAVIKPPLPQSSAVSISFVIANPGSYLYLTTSRPEKDLSEDYDNWKYGVAYNSSLAPYVASQGHDQASIRNSVQANFTKQRVTLLLGTKDTVTTGVLDKSPAAMTQGPNRYKRGLYYVEDLREHGLLHEGFVVKEVEGVGHNEEGMLLSDEAITAICS